MNKGRIYYLTNSFLPKKSGGVYARLLQVEALLKIGYEVIVVTAEVGQSTVSINEFNVQVIRIPSHATKLDIVMQHLGVIPDANYQWAVSACQILQSQINSKDLLFAVTGGDLSTYILGNLIKEKTSSKLILSYHDPVTYTDVNGLVINSVPHINRTSFEQNIIRNADLIITSSLTFRSSIIKKYNLDRNKVKQVYFGFRNSYEYIKNKNTKIHIIYAGNFSKIQSPELIIDVIKQRPELINNIKLTFIGNTERINKNKYENLNIDYVKYMDQSKCLKYIAENADLALVTLKGDYFANCFPSKIFDYISCNIPIIGIIPVGDASEFIKLNKIGIVDDAFHLQNVGNQLIEIVRNPDLIQKYKTNVIHLKLNYNFNNLINQLQASLDSIRNNQ